MSWEQLIAIRQEQVDTVLAELAAPPQACPNDGEPLREGPTGELFCPFDGWQPTQGDT
jgi:hypothetical protein